MVNSRLMKMKKKPKTESSTQNQGAGRKKRINLKLLFLLVAILGVLGLGGIGVIIRERRQDPAAFRAKAEALVAAGEYDLAVKQYQKALYYDSSDVSMLLDMAEAILNTEQKSAEDAVEETSRVLGLYRRATAVSASHREAHEKLLSMLFELSQLLRQQGTYEQMKDVAEQFLERNPGDPLGLKYKALGAVNLARIEGYNQEAAVAANETLQAAREALPEDVDLVMVMANWRVLEAVRMQETRDEAETEELWKQAEQLLTDYLQDHPDAVDVKLDLAALLLQRDSTEAGTNLLAELEAALLETDRKSTRLNSSHYS
mgnify:FL=1